MPSQWIAWISGLVLLSGLGSLVVAWTPQVLASTPQASGSGKDWVLLALIFAPYTLFALAAWGFRRDWRGSLAVFLLTVPGVALGVWAWWPGSPKTEDEGIAGGLVVLGASALQLLLSAVAVGWALAWSSESEAATEPDAGPDPSGP
jgi:hypothetical protein